jgi:hypothetical protein
MVDLGVTSLELVGLLMTGIAMSAAAGTGPRTAGEETRTAADGTPPAIAEPVAVA